jgi:hypothetical protein
MNRPEIELKKERDFSDVFNASFVFISQELRKLFKVTALYAGVPVIIAVILSVYYTQDTFSSFFQVIRGESTMNEPDLSLIFLSILFGVLAQVFIAGLIPAYLAEYEEKGQSGFGADDVWKRFLKHFGAILGYSFLSAIMIMIGTLFFIIPGIYLSVPLSFILYVKIIENRNLGDSFSRCVQLVRHNWWNTFGILILAYLIIGIVGSLFSLPTMIVAGIEGFLIGTGQQEAMHADSLTFVITTIFGGLGQYLLYPVLYVIIAFQYYALREQKDRDSLLEKVSAINDEE